MNWVVAIKIPRKNLFSFADKWSKLPNHSVHPLTLHPLAQWCSNFWNIVGAHITKGLGREKKKSTKCHISSYRKSHYLFKSLSSSGFCLLQRKEQNHSRCSQIIWESIHTHTNTVCFSCHQNWRIPWAS